MAEPLAGWYVDAVEQNLGLMVQLQRTAGQSVDELVEVFLDPKTPTGALSPEEHIKTMAVCLAICVRRLARVDMPS